MKTKILGITLILCFVFSAFLGMTAAAAGDLFIDQKWEINDSNTYDTDGALSITLGANMPFFSKQVAVSANKKYKLSFEYALNFDQKGELKVAGITADGNARAIVEPIRLSTTSGADIYEEYGIIFSPGHLEGSPLVSTVVYFEGKPIKEWESGKFNLRNIVMQEIPAEAIANGSAEYLDANNRPFGITGGTLVKNASFAKHGNNVMELASGETMKMDLGTEKAGVEKVKIRGYIQAKDMSAGSSVKVTFWKDTESADTKIAEKTYTFADASVEADASLKDIQNGVWEYFRFSHLPIGNKIVIAFSVEGNGSVYVDGVTMVEDKNIAADPQFIDAATNPSAGRDGSKWKFDTEKVSAASDGDCPDGQYYMILNGNGWQDPAEAYGRGNGGLITVTPNTRYIMSFWYRADSTCRVSPQFNFGAATTTYISGNASYTFPEGTDKFGPWLCYLKSTNGKWKQVSVLLTTPPSTTGVKAGFSFVAGNMAVSNFSLEKVDEKEIRFFVPDLSDCLSSDSMSGMQMAFMTYLGKPVEVQDELKTGESIKATCLVPVLDGDSHKLSTDKMILASYKTVNGTKRLDSIGIGELAALGGTDVAGVDCTTNANTFTLQDGTPLKYINYPSVTLTSDEIKDADLIRAFCWDTLFGLQAVVDASNIQ